MKHWKTREEMGEGFSFNESEHKENEYNSLIKIKEHEKNTMRTFYLIRDVWSKEQLIELKEFVEEQILEREDIIKEHEKFVEEQILEREDIDER